MGSIDINLLDRTFSVSCPEGKEEILKDVVATLQKEITNLEGKPGVRNTDVIMLAALNISHELHRKKTELLDLEQKIKNLEETVSSALDNAKPKAYTADTIPDNTKTVTGDFDFTAESAYS